MTPTELKLIQLEAEVLTLRVVSEECAALRAEVGRLKESRTELALINDEKHRAICGLKNDVRVAREMLAKAREMLAAHAPGTIGHKVCAAIDESGLVKHEQEIAQESKSSRPAQSEKEPMETTGQIESTQGGSRRERTAMTWGERLYEAFCSNDFAGLAEVLERVEETYLWTAQTIHQAHHDGQIEGCEKNTCTAIREVLTALRDWRDGISNGKGEMK